MSVVLANARPVKWGAWACVTHFKPSTDPNCSLLLENDSPTHPSGRLSARLSRQRQCQSQAVRLDKIRVRHARRTRTPPGNISLRQYTRLISASSISEQSLRLATTSAPAAPRYRASKSRHPARIHPPPPTAIRIAPRQPGQTTSSVRGSMRCIWLRSATSRIDSPTRPAEAGLTRPQTSKPSTMK
jgi:hypothetical protein